MKLRDVISALKNIEFERMDYGDDIDSIEVVITADGIMTEYASYSIDVIEWDDGLIRIKGGY